MAPALRISRRCRTTITTRMTTSRATTIRPTASTTCTVAPGKPGRNLDCFAGRPKPTQRPVAGGDAVRGLVGLGPAQRVTGPLDVDVLGCLGHLGEHRHSLLP